MKPTNHFYAGSMLFMFVLIFACSCKKADGDLTLPPRDPIPVSGTQNVVTNAARDSNIVAGNYSNIVVGNKEVLYQNTQWIFPWYNSLEAPHIYTYVPNNKPIKVFIKRGNSSTWQEVKLLTSNASNERYEYFIETRPDGAGMYSFGSLYIFYYGEDIGDTPDIKISF